MPKHFGAQAHHNEALQVRKFKYVDTAAIDRRISALPGEVSVLRVSMREVSRGHSSWKQRAVTEGIKAEASRSNEGLNVKLFKIR